MRFRHRLVNATLLAWVLAVAPLPELVSGVLPRSLSNPWSVAYLAVGGLALLALLLVLGVDGALYARGKYRSDDPEEQARAVLREAERRKDFDERSAAGGFRMLIRLYAHTDVVESERARIEKEATPDGARPFMGTLAQARERASIASSLASRPVCKLLLIASALRALLTPGGPLPAPLSWVVAGLILLASSSAVRGWGDHRRRAGRARAQLSAMREAAAAAG